MVYKSKRSRMDFFKTRNMKYYVAFLAMLLVIVATILLVKKNTDSRNSIETPKVSVAEEESTTIPIISSKGKYKICVNKALFQVTIYPYDNSSGTYSAAPEKVMMCAFNENLEEAKLTPEYSDSIKSTWAKVENGDGYTRFYTYFDNNYSFHSSRYAKISDSNTLNTNDYNAIGTSVNDLEGVTLLVADAKWIFENCAFNSEVMVYSNENEQNLLENISKIEIPGGITWEPTDDSEGTIWCDTKIESISSPDTIKLTECASSEALISHVKSLNSDNENVNRFVFVSGKYDLSKAGTYSISFNLIDKLGNHLSCECKLIITSKENETKDDDKKPTETDNTTDEETSSEETGTEETTVQETTEDESVQEETTAE